MHGQVASRVSPRWGLDEDMAELRREAEENDFLAIAQGLGIVDEKEVEEGREAERKRAKKEYDPRDSKFSGWMGGLMVGTPFSEERESVEDEDDILVRLAKRVEERRAELSGVGQEGAELSGVGQEEGAQQEDQDVAFSSIAKRVAERRAKQGDQVGNTQSAEDDAPEAKSPNEPQSQEMGAQRRKRRRRKPTD